jgi:DNA-binding response OmpR family regulator
MVTAHHTELDRVRGALAGCDGFLGKPLDDGELALYLARFGVRQAAGADRLAT